MEVQSWLRKQLSVRAMVQDVAEVLMGTEVDALCGAGYAGRRAD